MLSNKNESEWREEFIAKVDEFTTLIMPAESRSKILARLRLRLADGQREYGNKSFGLSFFELAEEIQQEMLDILGWSYIAWTKAKVLQENSLIESHRKAALSLQVKLLDRCLVSLRELDEVGRAYAVGSFSGLDVIYKSDPRRFICDLVLSGNAPQLEIEALKIDLTEQLAVGMEAAGLTAETLAQRLHFSLGITSETVTEQLREPSDLTALLLMFHACGLKLATNAIKIAEGNSDAD
jgi:hypothetical protein